MAEPGTFIGEVQRGLQRFWHLSWWWKGPILGVLIIVVIAIIAGLAGGGDGDSDAQVRAGEETQTASPTATEDDADADDEGDQTDRPTGTPTVRHTATPTPQPTPEPTTEPTPTPAPTPVVIEGFGLTATATVSPPSAISVVTLTHSGSSNFIVWSHQDGSEELMVNEIGAYSGSRPLFGDAPVLFDVDADGAWTITISPIAVAPSALFSGSGDDVSGLFDPPGSGGWNISHNGTSNFIAWLHCAGGSDLVANEIGPVSGSTVVSFDDGPCMWEVEADGDWSLSPQ